jgi:hypothetical protein
LIEIFPQLCKFAAGPEACKRVSVICNFEGDEEQIGEFVVLCGFGVCLSQGFDLQFVVGVVVVVGVGVVTCIMMLLFITSENSLDRFGADIAVR